MEVVNMTNLYDTDDFIELLLEVLRDFGGNGGD